MSSKRKIGSLLPSSKKQPYLAARLHRATVMTFLATKYGIKTKVEEPTLTAEETVIQEDISKLLEMIESHLDYWGKTSSKRTTNALTEAKHCVLSLLTAIRSPDHRLEKTCAAIYKKDLKSLVFAIRSPRINPNDQRTQTMRDGIKANRNTFKRLLKDIVIALKNMCIVQIDNAAFTQFVAAPKLEIEKWCAGQAHAVDEINVDEQLDNEDGIRIVTDQGPDGLYN